MDSNINLPGLEDFIITKTVERDGYYQLHVELEKTPHQCPSCGLNTDLVHDYRTQKIKYNQIFRRRTAVLYRKYRLWFEIAKSLAPNCLKEVKERLYQYYGLVKASGF